jgi:hypothetical protein
MITAASAGGLVPFHVAGSDQRSAPLVGGALLGGALAAGALAGGGAPGDGDGDGDGVDAGAGVGVGVVGLSPPEPPPQAANSATVQKARLKSKKRWRKSNIVARHCRCGNANEVNLKTFQHDLRGSGSQPEVLREVSPVSVFEQGRCTLVSSQQRGGALSVVQCCPSPGQLLPAGYDPPPF